MTNCDGSEHCLQSNIELVVWLAKLDHGTPTKYVANCVFTVYYTMSIIEPPSPPHHLHLAEIVQVNFQYSLWFISCSMLTVTNDAILQQAHWMLPW